MKSDVKRELSALADKAEAGLLQPESIVEYAKKNPKSALHGEFEWDNARAATEYRLQQARELLRVYVTVVPQTLQTVRGFLSVPTDRANGGGYRRTEDILKNDALRRQMVIDTLKKVEQLKSAVSYLPELQPFFTELTALVDRYRSAAVTAQAA
jgi:hypothetical protein